MQNNRELPKAIDAEEQVIGTILAYPDSINNVISILTPEMFVNGKLRNVYSCCVNLIQDGNGIDITLVTNELRKRKASDMTPYLIEMTGRIYTDKMIDNHALIIKEQYIKRQYIKSGLEISEMAYSADVADIAEMDLLKISNSLYSKEPNKLCKIVDGVIDNIYRLQNGEISKMGVPSGFNKFDTLTGGFKKGELIIIAARPGMGKSALALQIAKNCAESDNPVLLFTFEMPETDLGRRLLSGVSGRSNVELISGRCEINQLLNTSEQLRDLDIYIDDTSTLTIIELRAKARRMVLKYGIKLIIVDYLQLMKGVGQNREQEIASLSRGLKSLAKDLDVSIIALSQLNRGAEMRADKRPYLSELRESGSIEQDADMVLLLYRPAFYKINEITINGAEQPTEGIMIVDLAKNRNGVTGELLLCHNGSLTKINE